jgi:prepilin peptidase CpaA
MSSWTELQIVVVIGLFGMLLIAAACDVARFIIPNRIVIALGALFVAAAVSAGSEFAWLSHLGAGTLVFAIGWVLFHCRVMGGGDVKLWAVCALWMGLDLLPAQLVYVGVIGAVLGLVLLLLRMGLARAVALSPNGARMVLPRLLRAGEGIPYGVAIAGGSLLLTAEVAAKFA